MTAIKPEETVLRGAWLMEDGRIVADAVCQRIQAVVTGLTLLGVSHDGWSKLFRDPSDGRLWELSYPRSSSHGGGPPQLAQISNEEAVARFGSYE